MSWYDPKFDLKMNVGHSDLYVTVPYMPYEGESISNQPNVFPVDRDGQDFHALFQYVLYMGTKLHMYRVIL